MNLFIEYNSPKSARLPKRKKMYAELIRLFKYKKYGIKSLYDNNLLHGHLGNYSDSSYGNTRIYFVVNPMDIAACPYQDYSKFRMSALTPIGIMKPGESMEDFHLTPEMDEYIGELVQNHIARLEEDINSEEYKEHTIMKEVPNIDFTGYMKTIKEIATNVAKVRYTKL